jgi:hypothetical protein
VRGWVTLCVSASVQRRGHSVTQSLYHCVTVSLYHSVTVSRSNSAAQSLCHSATQSLCHSVTLPLSHSVTQSLSHSLSRNQYCMCSCSKVVHNKKQNERSEAEQSNLHNTVAKKQQSDAFSLYILTLASKVIHIKVYSTNRLLWFWRRRCEAKH